MNSLPPRKTSSPPLLQVADLNGSPPADVTKAEFVRQLIPAVIIAGLQARASHTPP